MRILLEDYQRKLKNIIPMVDEARKKSTGSEHDKSRITRLSTKESEYRSFIVDIERAIKREEISQLPEEKQQKCQFDKAWQGKCNKPADHTGYCDEHQGIKCCSCGEQATHDCSETGGFVCGFPLCDECIHTTQSNGCNSGGELPDGVNFHDKKTNQVYKPWYMRKNENDKVLSLNEKIALYPETYPNLPEEEKEKIHKKVLDELENAEK